MTDSLSVTPEGEADAPAELPTPSINDLRRNPRLAKILISVAWIFGSLAVFFPGVTASILHVKDLPDWAMTVTVCLIGITIFAGARGSYYNKAPREERFQGELGLAKKNLEAASRLITRLNEEFQEQNRKFEEIKTRIEDKRREEKYDADDAPSLARRVASELREEARRDDRRRWVRDILLLVVGFVLGVVGNWVASPLLTMFS